MDKQDRERTERDMIRPGDMEMAGNAADSHQGQQNKDSSARMMEFFKKGPGGGST
jgi:hypothetical protein